jgi:hypothetical protein
VEGLVWCLTGSNGLFLVPSGANMSCECDICNPKQRLSFQWVLTSYGPWRFLYSCNTQFGSITVIMTWWHMIWSETSPPNHCLSKRFQKHCIMVMLILTWNQQPRDKLDMYIGTICNHFYMIWLAWLDCHSLFSSCIEIVRLALVSGKLSTVDSTSMYPPDSKSNTG